MEIKMFLLILDKCYGMIIIMNLLIEKSKVSFECFLNIIKQI